MTSLTIHLPDELAEKAIQVGLLEPSSVEKIFKQALKSYENQEIEAIRQALIDGEQSGEPKPFNTNAFRQRMLAKHG